MKIIERISMQPITGPMRVKKEWIATAIGAGVGLASSIFGGIKASKAREKAEKAQKAREAEENAFFRRRYNEDYADTAAGQNLIRRAKDYARENWKKAAGAAAVTGATDASAQMAKDAGNKMVGDTIADIAATDVSRKDAAASAHQAARDRFTQMDINRYNQQANDITQAAQAASDAILKAGTAMEGDLNGGSNKGTTYQSGVNDGYNVAQGNQAISADIRSQLDAKYR